MASLRSVFFRSQTQKGRILPSRPEPHIIESKIYEVGGSPPKPTISHFTKSGIAAIRFGLIVALAFCIYLSVRQGIAACYFRQNVPSSIEHAIRWDPDNPQYSDALAGITHLYADADTPAEIIPLYERAVRVSSEKAQYWADLATAYDWAGRTLDAQSAYRRALELFPNSPQLNWTVANFEIRTGRITDGLAALRKVLLGNDIPPQTIFVLATNATSDNSVILNEMLPPEASPFFSYLDFQIENGRINDAQLTWDRLLELNLRFDVHQAFPYLDALIGQKRVGGLMRAWSDLAKRFPAQIHVPDSGGNRIINGQFRFDTLNDGLDWRIVPTEGATVSLDSANSFEGRRSLRIDFDGNHNLDYRNFLQFVPVKPDTRYKFQAFLRTEGITTDSGPRVEIYDAYDMRKLFLSTENLIGTTAWKNEELDFQTPADTQLLIVKVARPISEKFDNEIAGSVWVNDVRLTENDKVRN